MTYQELVNAAVAAKYGSALTEKNGHVYTLKLTDVGSPRTGLSSAKYQRRDHYIDGKRVKREYFLQMLEVSK